MKRRRTRVTHTEKPTSVEVKIPAPISAEQAQLLQFQSQLHEQGQERFRALEKALEQQNEIQVKHGETLAKIVENTRDLPQLKIDVDGIKRTHIALKRGVKVVGGVTGSSAFIAGVKWVATKLMTSGVGK